MSDAEYPPSYPPPGPPSGPPGYPPGYPSYAPPAASAYAHWGQRVGAYLIDALLVLPGYIVAWIGAALASGGSGGASAVGALLMVVGYLGAAVVAIWNQVFRQGRTGWSIGKKVLGIRLLAEATGQPLGPLLTFARALAHILDALPCYLGFLWPLWDAKRQTFADKIVHSVVVPQPEPPSGALRS
jgi:uncharacterized RDD family membrane protein YckC